MARAIFGTRTEGFGLCLDAGPAAMKLVCRGDGELLGTRLRTVLQWA